MRPTMLSGVLIVLGLGATACASDAETSGTTAAIESSDGGPESALPPTTAPTDSTDGKLGSVSPTTAHTEPSDVASESTAPNAVAIRSTGDDEIRDLIRPEDPSAFACLVDLGIRPGEFYDKVADELLFPENTSFFEARYTDGATVEVRIHPDLVGAEGGADQALRIAEPIGLLPTELRAGIGRVGFLGGDATAQGDGGGEGIHVYAENVAVRERANRFEETLFHESVHTSLDDELAASPEWLAAGDADGRFLTEYAAQQPAREDLAETALYAWALLHHPDRVTAADATAWRAAVPNRIDVIASALSGPPGAASAPVDC